MPAESARMLAAKPTLSQRRTLAALWAMPGALLAMLAAMLAVMPAAPALAQDNPPAPAGCTGPASETWIKVEVEGVRNDHGLIAVTLYADDASRFLVKHGSLYVGRVRAETATTTACLFVPHHGMYALAVYHDANGNERFDRTMFGLPAEAYGFSNNPNTLFGLPNFSSVLINITKSGQVARIRLHYP